MKNFKHKRIRMGLSQLKMANYLGVSRSLIYFVDKGLRRLPTWALIKFAQLEEKFNELSQSTEPALVISDIEQKQKREKVKKCLREKERLNVRILSLKVKRTTLKRAYRKCIGATTTNLAIAHNIQHIKADSGDDLWLSINIKDTYDKLEYCSKAKQKALLDEIRKTEASIAILDEYIRENMLRLEAPVMRMAEAA